MSTRHAVPGFQRAIECLIKFQPGLQQFFFGCLELLPKDLATELTIIPTWLSGFRRGLEFLSADRGFLGLFSQLGLHRCRGAAGGGTKRSQSGGSKGDEGAHRSLKGKGRGAGGQNGKRPLDDDRDDDDSAHQLVKRLKTRTGGRPFGCPYFHNPEHRPFHPECAEWKDAKISVVKEHVTRHLKPYRCGRCKTFQMADITKELNKHLEDDCRLQDTMDPSGIEALKKFEAVNKAITWEKIYEALFPYVIPSPFWPPAPLPASVTTQAPAAVTALATASTSSWVPVPAPGLTPALVLTTAPVMALAPSVPPSPSPVPSTPALADPVNVGWTTAGEEIDEFINPAPNTQYPIQSNQYYHQITQYPDQSDQYSDQYTAAQCPYDEWCDNPM